MAYRSIHIPFYTGQDESVDVKLLPMGPMRAVFNMQLERDGRMARRKRLQVKDSVTATGETVDKALVEFAEPNSIITYGDDYETRVYHWVNGDTSELLNLEGGVLPLFSSTENLFSDLDASGTTAAEVPDDDRSQQQPQVVVDFNGNIVTSFIQGILVIIEFREPRKLQPFHRIEYEMDIVGAANNDFFATAKIVASKVTPKLALAYWRTTGLPAALRLVTFDIGGDFALTSDEIVESSVADLPRLFDIAERPDHASFILTHASAASIWTLSEYNFSDGSLVGDLDTATTTFGNGATGCYATADRWYWGYSDSSYVDISTAGDLTLRSDAWNGSGITAQVIAADSLPTNVVWYSGSPGQGSPITGPMFTSGESGDEVIVTWNQTPFEGQNPPWTAAYYCKWDVSANTIAFNFRHSELLITAPVGYSRDGGSSKTYHSLSEGAYYSRNDTDSEFEPSSPATVLSWRIGGESDGGSNANTMITGAMAVIAGCRYLGSSSVVLPQDARHFFNDRTMPKPAQYTVDGEERCIWPVQIENGRASTTERADFIKSYEARWVVSVVSNNKPRALRGKETLVPNATLSASDGSRVIQSFTGPPNFLRLFSTGAGFVTDGVYKLSAVLEYRDANGRLHRSAPSVIRENTVSASNLGILETEFTIPAGIAGQGNGAILVIYCTNTDGNVLFRRSSHGVRPGVRVLNTRLLRVDDAPAGAEALYTATGEVSNNPAPSCQFITGTRSRIWAGGLTDRSAIQASKPLNDLQGVTWSQLDNFKVFLPHDVTGMAPMDDSLVVFTRDRVYAVHGAGPNSSGVGVFSQPQVIPGSTGCINSKSVIATEVGIFYQSSRGLEIVPRGFATPQWIGQSVRDTIDDFPICKGASQSPDDWTVRWLFQTESGDDSRTIIWDLRAQSWYVHSHTVLNDVFDVIGTCTGKPGDPDSTNMFLGSLASNNLSAIEDDTPGHEALSADNAFVETGSLRVAGLQSWGFGRDVYVLGKFGGRDCTVTIEFAFSDQDFLPIDTFTWTLTQSDYRIGEAIELAITLPVQQFSAVQFRVTVKALNGNTDDQYTFKPNALSVYYTPAPEGPRLAARNRG